MPNPYVHRICNVGNCNNKFYCRDVCIKHYKRLRKYGDPLFCKKPQDAVCVLQDCEKPAIAKGLCCKHYSRLRRHGSTEHGRQIGKGLAFLKEVALFWQSSDCLDWPFAKANYGYGEIWVAGRKRIAHRIVCEMAYGPPAAEKNDAAHSCCNRLCVNPRHLRWASRSENVADSRAHGTMVRGERSVHAKLTEQQVREILSLKGQASQTEIGARFGVSRRSVNSILRRETWRHIT